MANINIFVCLYVRSSLSRHDWVPSRIYGGQKEKSLSVGGHGFRPNSVCLLIRQPAQGPVFVFGRHGGPRIINL